MSMLRIPNISTPGFRLDVDVEIQVIEIEADWGGIKTDLGDFSFDFSPADISPDLGLRSIPVCDGSTVRRDGFRPVRRATLPVLKTDGYGTGSPV
jgi:hypothetical protein